MNRAFDWPYTIYSDAFYTKNQLDDEVIYDIKEVLGLYWVADIKRACQSYVKQDLNSL